MSTKQRGFDFADPSPMPAHCPTTGAAIPPRDPNADERDVPRLAGQNLAILNLLRSKPEASNVEIARTLGVLKHTSRLSDLRKAGYTVNARRGDGGVWWYSLGEEHKSEAKERGR